MSHHHVWGLQEPEPGEFAFHRENEIHLSRATASRKRAGPDDIVRVCYAATPRPDARPHWAAFCRKLNERSTAPGTPQPRPAAAPLSLSCSLSITPCTFAHYDEQSAGTLLAPPLLSPNPPKDGLWGSP